jgi:hypothetical protein
VASSFICAWQRRHFPDGLQSIVHGQPDEAATVEGGKLRMRGDGSVNLGNGGSEKAKLKEVMLIGLHWH